MRIFALNQNVAFMRSGRGGYPRRTTTIRSKEFIEKQKAQNIMKERMDMQRRLNVSEGIIDGMYSYIDNLKKLSKDKDKIKIKSVIKSLKDIVKNV